MSDYAISAQHLKQFIERIERLEEDKKNIAEDIKEVFAEAKANGFDTKIMRQVIRLRKMEENEREENDYLLDVYKSALGMLPEHESATSDESGEGEGAANAEAA